MTYHSRIDCRFMLRAPFPKTLPLVIELLLIAFPSFKTVINFRLVGSATKSTTAPISGGRGIAELFLPLRKYPRMPPFLWWTTPEDNVVRRTRVECEARSGWPF